MFPTMASEGEIPSSPQDPPPKVIAIHTLGISDEFEYQFPHEGFPYESSTHMGNKPTPPLESSETLFPLGYTSLGHLVSGNPRTYFLYHHSIGHLVLCLPLAHLFRTWLPKFLFKLRFL